MCASYIFQIENGDELKGKERWSGGYGWEVNVWMRNENDDENNDTPHLFLMILGQMIGC